MRIWPAGRTISLEVEPVSHVIERLSIALHAVARLSLAVQHVFQRPGHRSWHRQHPGLCGRQGHRCQRALHRGHQQEHRRGGSRGQGGQGDAGPHARQHRGHQAHEGRRHRRLQSHREDAELLHPEGAQPQDAGASAHRHRRAFRDYAGGKARGRGLGLPRQGQRGLSRRAGHGGGHRRRAAHHRALAATWWWTSAAAPRTSPSSRSPASSTRAPCAWPATRWTRPLPII
jgi:hypothetical protein